MAFKRVPEVVSIPCYFCGWSGLEKVWGRRSFLVFFSSAVQSPCRCRIRSSLQAATSLSLDHALELHALALLLLVLALQGPLRALQRRRGLQARQRGVLIVLSRRPGSCSRLPASPRRPGAPRCAAGPWPGSSSCADLLAPLQQRLLRHLPRPPVRTHAHQQMAPLST